MNTFQRSTFSIITLSLLLLLAACGPTTSQVKPQQTVTINKDFQSDATPMPTVPSYRCGAWASNNAPDPYSTIAIYARLTKDVAPVGGAIATAVVHFKGFDQPLESDAPTDSGGYVKFTLSLQGHQPSQVPATVDVIFTNIPGSHQPLHCTPAFFTPQ